MRQASLLIELTGSVNSWGSVHTDVLRRLIGRAIIPQQLQEDKNGLEREDVCILAEAIQAVNGKWERVGSLILELLLAMLIPLGIL